MDRRTFLQASLLGGFQAGAALGVAAGAMGTGLPVATALGSVAGSGSAPAPGPYGSLDRRPADTNGLVLPEGFTARVVAEGGSPVPGSDRPWPLFPDGKGTLSIDDGGWLLVCNHELFDFQTPSGPLGGASAIGFAPDGSITGSWPVLTGSHSNSRGAVTPWGTWLSCQEAYGEAGGDGDGLVWECDPFGDVPAVARPVLGRRTHGSVAVDADGGYAYLTEAHRDGRLYRVSLSGAGDPLGGGGSDADRMEALAVDPDGGVRWLSVLDPSGSFIPTRFQVVDGLVTPMGGGVAVHDGLLVFTTGLDDRLHAVDLAAGHHSVIWDGSGRRGPAWGIGDLTVSGSGDLFVSEDRGDMEVVVVTPFGEVAPFCRMVGNEHRLSQVTGPCFDPSGTRLYVSSLRGRGEALVRDVVPDLDWGPGAEGRHVGVTYEISGPFRTTASPPAVTTTTAEPAAITVVLTTSEGGSVLTTTTAGVTTSPSTTIAAGPGEDPAGGVETETGVVQASGTEGTTGPSSGATGRSVVPTGLATVLLALGGAVVALRRRRDREASSPGSEERGPGEGSGTVP